LERRSCRTHGLPVDLTLAGTRLNCYAIHKLHSPNPRMSSPWEISYGLFQREQRQARERELRRSPRRNVGHRPYTRAQLLIIDVRSLACQFGTVAVPKRYGPDRYRDRYTRARGEGVPPYGPRTPPAL